MKRLDHVLTIVVFFAALVLYIHTAPPDMIYDGGVSVDSAELQRVANRLGIAHSTGYPTYTLLGYVAARIGEGFGDSPYTWITYFSALCSALALAIFFRLILRMGDADAMRLPALGVTALLGVTNIYWHMSTIAEVQALQMLIIVGIASLALAHLRAPQNFRIVAGMALLAGLGLTNHRMIVLVFPAAGLVLLLTRFWRNFTLRQMASLIVLACLPVLAYGYLYIRAEDPFVVYGIRPTWIPVEISTQDITNLITGTFQNGDSLNGNIVFSGGDLLERFVTVWNRIPRELSWMGVLGGIIGLVALAIRRWRVALFWLVYLAPLIVFLMGWRVDVKAQIYSYLLLLPFLAGLAYLVSALYLPRHRMIAQRVLIVPVLLLVTLMLAQNFPARNLSADRETETFRAQLDDLPEDSTIYNGIWQPETFIILEYLDDTGRQDLLPMGTDLWWVPLDDMRDPEKSVYISTSMRSIYGLYDGQTWFQEQENIAFSGTATETFLQAHSPDDPRISTEAHEAIIVKTPITADIELYSYDLTMRDDGLNITLYWQATDSVQEGYAVYTHVRAYDDVCNEDGQLLAQDDSYAPVQGAYPTPLWEEGQIVKDTYFIPADALNMTDSALVIGMTNHTDGQRNEEFCLPLNT